LERANEKFRSLFEKSSIPQILLTDVIIDFNKAACELFQYCEDKIINKKIEDFFPKNPANETTSLDRFYGYKKEH